MRSASFDAVLRRVKANTLWSGLIRQASGDENVTVGYAEKVCPSGTAIAL